MDAPTETPTVTPIRLVSLFSGVGSLTLGLEAALGGPKTSLHVEPDAYCRDVLRRHWPEARVVGSAVPRASVAPAAPAVLCASLALDEADARWTEILAWVANLQPVVALFVAPPQIASARGLPSGARGELFSTVLSGLHRAGYDAQWRMIDATEAGAPLKQQCMTIMACRRAAEPVTLSQALTPEWEHVVWPETPGQPQSLLEPQRVDVTRGDNHRLRLGALATVPPHCAYLAGLWVRAALAGPLVGPTGKFVVAFAGDRRVPKQSGLFETAPAPCPTWPKNGSMIGGTARALRSKALRGDASWRRSEVVTPYEGRVWRRAEIRKHGPDWVECLMGLPIGWTQVGYDVSKRVRAASASARREAKKAANAADGACRESEET
jgi:hypothetical protein